MNLHLELRHVAPQLDFRATLPVGKITALVGPSGSGKTSVLRAIAGLLRPEHVRVEIAGEVWDDERIHLPTQQRPLGFVPQHYGLFPHLTARGNVETALLALPNEERRKRALAYLEAAHVADCAERQPRQLSGGQKQRVALARAIAREPKLLLLDEPFSAVDRATRKSLYVELRQLHAHRPITILVVTHDLDEAAQLASHLVLLDAGKIVQTGSTDQLMTQPATRTAARLLDIPNVFPARIENRDGRFRLRWGSHLLAIGKGERLEGDCHFAVLPHNVLLIRPDKPWGTHLENPIDGRIADILQLGPEAVVWIDPVGLAGDRLQMRLPTRALKRHAMSIGDVVQFSLRAADLILLEG